MKFVDLLDCQKLYFSRADLLGDPYEGSWAHANFPQHSDIATEGKKTYAKFSTKRTFVNCWHMNNVESAAMWDLYAKSNTSIAIISTYATFEKELNASETGFYLGCVKYIDYRVTPIPEDNLLYPFIYKRKSYEHEKELRAFVSHMFGGVDLSQEPPAGVKIVVNLEKLINAVFVAPQAPHWFFVLVKNILQKYNLNVDVQQSSLDETPPF